MKENLEDFGLVKISIPMLLYAVYLVFLSVNNMISVSV